MVNKVWSLRLVKVVQSKVSIIDPSYSTLYSKVLYTRMKERIKKEKEREKRSEGASTRTRQSKESVMSN